MFNKKSKNKLGYIPTKKKANRIWRRKKKEWIEGKIKEINEISKKRDIRKLYEDIGNLSNLPTVTTLVGKDKDSNMLSEKKANVRKIATILEGITKS
jgi:hypothetical protein